VGHNGRGELFTSAMLLSQRGMPRVAALLRRASYTSLLVIDKLVDNRRFCRIGRRDAEGIYVRLTKPEPGGLSRDNEEAIWAWEPSRVRETAEDQNSLP
jgi:hypothetical protein